MADMKKEAGIVGTKIKQAVQRQTDLVKNSGVYNGAEVKEFKNIALKEVKDIKALQDRTETEALAAVQEVREMTKDINKYLKNEYKGATREINQTARQVTKEIRQAVK